MSALAGLVAPIWANEVERQLVWRVLHQYKEKLKIDMGALQERIRSGHDGSLKGAWHVLDTEHALLTDICARILAAPEQPPF